MARIQQSRSGSRIKRERIHAKEIKDALKSTIESMGIKSHRFGEMRTKPKEPNSPS